MPQSLNVLVIGGSGFLSGTLAARAVAEGHSVTCLLYTSDAADE